MKEEGVGRVRVMTDCDVRKGSLSPLLGKNSKSHELGKCRDYIFRS